MEIHIKVLLILLAKEIIILFKKTYLITFKIQFF